jgi:hypothetical protein
MQLLSALHFRHPNTGKLISKTPTPAPVSRSQVTTIAVAFKTFSFSVHLSSQVSLATSWINEYAYYLQTNKMSMLI